MCQASTAGRQGIAAMSSSRSAIQIHGDLLAAACRWVANRLDLHLVPITLQLGRLSCCYKKRLVGLALQCGHVGSGISSLNGVKVCGVLLCKVFEVADDLLQAVGEDHQVPASVRGTVKRH